MVITPNKIQDRFNMLNIENKNKLITEISEIIGNNANLDDFVITNDADGNIDVSAKVYVNNLILNDEIKLISTLGGLGYYEVGTGSDQSFDSTEQLVKWWLFEADDPIL